MSNYPVWWDTTITIYNRYEDPQTQLVKWYRTTVTNCFWKHDKTKIVVGKSVIESDSTICRIPENPDFLEKYQWVELPNDMMASKFTLGIGDIVVRGLVNDNIDEYTNGHRATDFLTKYQSLQGCIKIDEISINTGIGRNNPHYFIRGI